MANSVQTVESTPVGPKKGQNKILRKSAIFQSLEGRLPNGVNFCILGPIWSPKACWATCGRFTPFPHAQSENRPSFRSMGFPRNKRWIMCRWSPEYHWGPPEHPGDTSNAFSARQPTSRAVLGSQLESRGSGCHLGNSAATHGCTSTADAGPLRARHQHPSTPWAISRP